MKEKPSLYKEFQLSYLRFFSNRKTRIVMVVSYVVLAIITFSQDIFDLSRMFVPSSSDSVVEANGTTVNIEEVNERFDKIDERIDELSESDQTEEIQSELQDLRKLILGDPETVLSIQTMNSKISSLEQKLDFIWDITRALAIAFIGAVLGNILLPHLKKSES